MTARLYIVIFAILIALTTIELSIVSTSFFATYSVTVMTLVGLAGVKAVLVALFFQDLKDEPKSLSSLLLLALVIGMTLMTISFLQLHPAHF